MPRSPPAPQRDLLVDLDQRSLHARGADATFDAMNSPSSTAVAISRKATTPADREASHQKYWEGSGSVTPLTSPVSLLSLARAAPERFAPASPGRFTGTVVGRAEDRVRGEPRERQDDQTAATRVRTLGRGAVAPATRWRRRAHGWVGEVWVTTVAAFCACDALPPAATGDRWWSTTGPGPSAGSRPLRTWIASRVRTMKKRPSVAVITASSGPRRATGRRLGGASRACCDGGVGHLGSVLSANLEAVTAREAQPATGSGCQVPREGSESGNVGGGERSLHLVAGSRAGASRRRRRWCAGARRRPAAAGSPRSAAAASRRARCVPVCLRGLGGVSGPGRLFARGVSLPIEASAYPVRPMT